MALLLMDGFEFAPIYRPAYGSTAGSAWPGRDGIGKALSCSSALTFTLPAPVSTLIIGFGFYSSAAWGTTMMTVHGDAGAQQHLVLGTDATGHFQVLRGGGTAMGAGSVGTSVMSLNAWHWIEFKCTIADAGGIAIGRLDGVEEFNYTGDTRNAGTLTTVSNVKTIPATGNNRFDDLVMCDTTGSAPFNDFFGEKVIRYKGPNGNGATNAWVGSDGNSTDNYLLVDELPPSSTDYVGSATAGDRDLYALSNYSGSLGTIYAVQNSTYAAKSDAGARSIKTLTRDSSGNVTSSSAVALSTTYGLLAGGIEQTTPAGTTWDTTNVNAIQAGVECV